MTRRSFFDNSSSNGSANRGVVATSLHDNDTVSQCSDSSLGSEIDRLDEALQRARFRTCFLVFTIVGLVLLDIILLKLAPVQIMEAIAAVNRRSSDETTHAVLETLLSEGGRSRMKGQSGQSIVGSGEKNLEKEDVEVNLESAAQDIVSIMEESGADDGDISTEDKTPKVPPQSTPVPSKSSIQSGEQHNVPFTYIPADPEKETEAWMTKMMNDICDVQEAREKSTLLRNVKKHHGILQRWTQNNICAVAELYKYNISVPRKDEYKYDSSFLYALQGVIEGLRSRAVQAESDCTALMRRIEDAISVMWVEVLKAETRNGIHRKLDKLRYKVGKWRAKWAREFLQMALRRPVYLVALRLLKQTRKNLRVATMRTASVLSALNTLLGKDFIIQSPGLQLSARRHLRIALYELYVVPETQTKDQSRRVITFKEQGEKLVMPYKHNSKLLRKLFTIDDEFRTKIWKGMSINGRSLENPPQMQAGDADTDKQSKKERKNKSRKNLLWAHLENGRYLNADTLEIMYSKADIVDQVYGAGIDSFATALSYVDDEAEDWGRRMKMAKDIMQKVVALMGTIVTDGAAAGALHAGRTVGNHVGVLP